MMSEIVPECAFYCVNQMNLRKIENIGGKRNGPALYSTNLRVAAIRDETIPTQVSISIEGGQKLQPISIVRQCVYRCDLLVATDSQEPNPEHRLR